MGTGEIVLVVNGDENGVVLEGGGGRGQEVRLTSVPRLICSMGRSVELFQAELKASDGDGQVQLSLPARIRLCQSRFQSNSFS